MNNERMFLWRMVGEWPTSKILEFKTIDYFGEVSYLLEDGWRCDTIAIDRFTGKQDKDSIPIFENDIIRDSLDEYFVWWSNKYCAFFKSLLLLKGDDNAKNEHRSTLLNMQHYEIIGNLHEMEINQ